MRIALVLIGFAAAVAAVLSSDRPLARAAAATAPAAPAAPAAAGVPARGRPTTWVTGTVRDTAGRPVAGAGVWAYATYHGGLRMYESVRKATTGPDGRYAIEGEARLDFASASIVAHAPGRPPAWAWVESLGGERLSAMPGEEEFAPVAAVDLVIPGRGATLDVAVFRDGKPVAGAAVGLSLQGVNLRDEWARDDHGPVREEVVAIVHPVRTAGADGVARFDALLPGRYEVIASAGDGRGVRDLQHPWRRRGDEPAYGVAAGVPVALGRANVHRIAIREQPNEAVARVFGSDGRPIRDGEVSYDYVSFALGSGWGTRLELGADGLGRPRFESPGLWRVSFWPEGDVGGRYPPAADPHVVAGGVLAVSALLPPDPAAAPTFRARRLEPGAIVVELVGLDGRPGRGDVEIETDPGVKPWVRPADASGIARFERLAPMAHVILAHPPGHRPLDAGRYEFAVPDAGQLRGRTAYLAERVVAAHGVERRVVLREREVGYVRGVVRPAEKHDGDDYDVGASAPNTPHGVRVHYRPSTGEFAAGPFAPGEVRVTLWYNGRGRTGGPPGVRDERVVKVKAGEVAPVELVAREENLRPLAGQGSVRIGMDGIGQRDAGAEGLAARVLLPDGGGPALGAVVMRFEPERSQPTLGGLADALGRVRAKGLWYSPSAPAPALGEGPDGPVVVALLAGTHGAAIVPAPEPGMALEIVLPPALGVRGRVTVGGRAPSSALKGTVRVFAAYEGRARGRLRGVLSVQTSAQEDGSFELAGLTPGIYTLQAALDDIWLSQPLAMNVAPGRPPAPVELAIGAPGGAVVVRVVGHDGEPLPGRAVTIDGRTGPLGAVLWPGEWVTDGAGEVYVPALEAGRHTFRVTGSEARVEAVVPPLPARRAVEVTLRLRSRGDADGTR